MAFDGLFTRAITHEIANSLQTGRISKIYQPSKYEVLLHIRANGKNQKLILSSHPTYARMHLNKSKLQFTSATADVLHASSQTFRRWIY